MTEQIDWFLVAQSDASVLIKNMLVRLAQEWPDMRILIGPSEDTFSPPQDIDSRLPRFSSDVLVAPNKYISDEWDEKGYADYGNGLGPLVLAYTPSTVKMRSMQVTDDISASTGDKTFNLYRKPFNDTLMEINVCTEGMSIVDLISPEETTDLRNMVENILHEELLAMAGTAPYSSPTRNATDQPDGEGWILGE